MTAPIQLRAPFPWFGGKSRAAHLVWEAFGDVANYVEPFAGSLAVLLGRPTPPRIETVNDRDCYLANAWRAIKSDPEQVAFYCDDPVNEADLHARHKWLVEQAAFRERMLTDPDFFDAKIAGWWLWGISAWIGGGWCDVGGGNTGSCRNSDAAEESIAPAPAPLRSRARRSPSPPPDSSPSSTGRRASTSSGSPEVSLTPSRQLPHLHASKGVHRSCGGSFDALAARLRRVRVACGEWDRVLGDSVTWRLGVTGVILDPPYAEGEAGYTHNDQTISGRVRAWAIANGSNPLLRIALCGYEGEHDMPATWRKVEWKAKGGYGSQRKDGTNENAKRERIWFSPHCLNAAPTLFDRMTRGAA